MKKYIKNIIKLNKKFVKCGICGWILENCWTGFLSFRRRDKKLTCNSSVWMLPIYGSACLFMPLSKKIKNRCFVTRGIIYTAVVFAIEFITGTLLKKNKCCPWDYSRKKYNINGVIRLDYAPLWFVSGLLFEKINAKKSWFFH